MDISAYVGPPRGTDWIPKRLGRVRGRYDDGDYDPGEVGTSRAAACGHNDVPVLLAILTRVGWALEAIPDDDMAELSTFLAERAMEDEAEILNALRRWVDLDDRGAKARRTVLGGVRPPIREPSPEELDVEVETRPKWLAALIRWGIVKEEWLND